MGKITTIKTRMCVLCRVRGLQGDLHRLQFLNGKLQQFSGQGRSFYVCNKCCDSPKLGACVMRVCRIDKREKDIIDSALKEIFWTRSELAKSQRN